MRGIGSTPKLKKGGAPLTVRSPTTVHEFDSSSLRGTRGVPQSAFSRSILTGRLCGWPTKRLRLRLRCHQRRPRRPRRPLCLRRQPPPAPSPRRCGTCRTATATRALATMLLQIHGPMMASVSASSSAQLERRMKKSGRLSSLLLRLIRGRVQVGLATTFHFEF